MIVTNYRRTDLVISNTVISPNCSAIVNDEDWFAYATDATVHDDIVNRRIVAAKESKKREQKK